MNQAVYELLYHLTFVAHAALVAFVFGGSAWLVAAAARQILTGRSEESKAAATLRDLLPFALGLGITFGIGPLLFIQLLAGHGFYSACILLAERFMAILPALIVGFYLLYVQKANWPWVSRPSLRLIVAAVAMLCFGYTGWSFSEVHLLRLQPDSWPQVYAEGREAARLGEVPFRMLIFAGLAAQITALALALGGLTDRRQRRVCAVVAAVGVGALAAGLVLYPTGTAGSLANPMPWLLVTCQALAMVSWLVFWSYDRVRSIDLRYVVALLTLVSVERYAACRTTGTQPMDAASPQGFELFVVLLLVVATAIAWCIYSVRREVAANP